MTAIQFFEAHASWSYDAASETPEQGRHRSARRLAAAERLAQMRGYRFVWVADEPRDHVAEFDAYDTEPDTCEVCLVLSPDGRTLASLGCVDDATDEYRRCIAAEVALDAIDFDDAERYELRLNRVTNDAQITIKALVIAGRNDDEEGVVALLRTLDGRQGSQLIGAMLGVITGLVAELADDMDITFDQALDAILDPDNVQLS